MKNQFLLDIRKPCSEKWENFQPTSVGGFCNTCSSEVVDFTTMSDEEIVAYFSRTTGKTCGRFRADQLKKYDPIVMPTIMPGARLLRAGLIGLFVFMVIRPGMALPAHDKTNSSWVRNSASVEKNVTLPEDHLIKGIVKSDDGQPLAGASIYLKSDPKLGTISNANGEFEFPKKLKEGEVIVFSFLGFDPQEYVVTKEANEKIELTFTMSNTILMGAVAVDHVYQKPTGLKKAWQKVKGLF